MKSRYITFIILASLLLTLKDVSQYFSFYDYLAFSENLRTAYTFLPFLLVFISITVYAMSKVDYKLLNTHFFDQ